MKIVKRINCIILALFAFVIAVISGQFPLSAYLTAYAETVGIDGTAIEDDFESIGLDIGCYSKKEDGNPSVIYFLENCYSDNPTLKSAYGLYLYVYNPSETPIDSSSNLHSVNMATAFDTKGEPISYENVQITALDNTDNCRFYKFKITNSTAFLWDMQEYAYKHEGKRRYDFAGLQIKFTGASLPQDFEVAKSYTWTGFAKGCGANTEAESTLACSSAGTDVLNLEIEHTTWRNIDSAQDYICDAVSTVYFGLPEKYAVDYMKLQAITAEWYEYKTKPIFVTSSGNGYNELFDWIGTSLANPYAESSYEQVGETNRNLTFRVLWEEYVYSMTGNGAVMDAFDKCYNGKQFTYDGKYSDCFRNVSVNGALFTLGDNWSYLTTLDWLFLANGGNDVDNWNDYFISPKQVEDYMKWYTANIGFNDTMVLEQFSSDLFEKTIDNDRIQHLEYKDTGATSGYVKQTIIDDKDDFDLKFYEKKDWFTLGDWLLGKTHEWKSKDFDPFVVLSPEEMNGLSKNQFNEKYLIDDNNTSSDSGSVYTDCRELAKQGKYVVLFRFAVTDYYSSSARFDNTDAWTDKDYDGSKNLSDINGYVAQETVFLNFDILSLRFLNRDGITESIVPVVADPINIIAGLIAPADIPIEDTPWWQKLIALILLVLLVVIFWPLLLPLLGNLISLVIKGFGKLLNGALKIATLPLRLIGWLWTGKG